MNDAARHCLELVREGDKDRFLASLFAPEEKRLQLFALFAFNVEIARIPSLVSEPGLGEIRQQWWLDTLDALGRGDTVDHPVARELASTIAGMRLPVQTLKNLIEARRFDLYSDPMPSLEALETYLGQTASALIQLSVLILDKNSTRATAEAAGLAGVAYGLARLLASGGAKRYLPSDIVSERGEAGTISFLVAHARRRLAEARRHVVPPAARAAFLVASLADLYLNSLTRLGAKALTRSAEVSQLQRQWRLWRRAGRESF